MTKHLRLAALLALLSLHPLATAQDVLAKPAAAARSFCQPTTANGQRPTANGQPSTESVSSALGRAMLEAAKHGAPKRVLEPADIDALADSRK